MVGKFALGVKAKHCWAFVFKSLLTSPSNVFALLPQVNFPANSLNFYWRWWDKIQAILLNLFYLKLPWHVFTNFEFLIPIFLWSVRGFKKECNTCFYVKKSEWKTHSEWSVQWWKINKKIVKFKNWKFGETCKNHASYLFRDVSSPIHQSTIFLSKHFFKYCFFSGLKSSNNLF